MPDDITSENLHRLLDYDQKTGFFHWKLSYGGKISGSRAGSVTKAGYIVIRILGKLYYAHRLAWLCVNGYFPIQEIDHIDCNKKNNSFSNLRLGTHAQNSRNGTRRKNNLSGFKGVSWNKYGHKWQAHIMVCGKSMYLGLFKKREEAAQAYWIAAQRHHKQFARMG